LVHIISRGVRRLAIFLDDTDRHEFLRLLLVVRARYGWRYLTYCLMDNHYHLLVETPEPNLSAGMQWLNSRYAEYFNDRHEVEGHVFERRFRDVIVRDDKHLVDVARYIVLNPVRAGICRRPEQWPWSSYAETTGAAPPRITDPERLLRYFGGAGDAARAAFVAHVQEGHDRGLTPVMSGKGYESSVRTSRAPPAIAASFP
jgi:REP element-mobilizing transposase RayT